METIDRVKQMIADGVLKQEDAEKYIPELAESEDEKIRKAIIKGFLNYSESFETFGGLKVGDIIAWLEKQGEPNADFKIEKGKWYMCIKDLCDDYSNVAFKKGNLYKGIFNNLIMPENSYIPYNLTVPKYYFRPATEEEIKGNNGGISPNKGDAFQTTKNDDELTEFEQMLVSLIRRTEKTILTPEGLAKEFAPKLMNLARKQIARVKGTS